MRSLTTELLRHKRITTTAAKAKETRRFVESVITKAKRAYLAEKEGGEMDLHARRVIGRFIADKAVLRELFTDVAAKVADRPGGYTRVIKLGRRNGDGAQIAVIELVDWNMDRDENAARSKTKSSISRAERVRRSQEKQKGAADEPTKAGGKKKADKEEEAVVADAETTLTDEQVVEQQDDGAPNPDNSYENVSEEVASGEDPAEPMARDNVANQQKIPAVEGQNKEGLTDSQRPTSSDDSKAGDQGEEQKGEG